MARCNPIRRTELGTRRNKTPEKLPFYYQKFAPYIPTILHYFTS